MTEVHHQTADELVTALTERCRSLQAEVLSVRAELEVARGLMEPHYTQQQLAVLLCRTTRTVLDHVREGHFGPSVVQDGPDYLVPASGVRHFLETRKLFVDAGPDMNPVRARTAGELRRKHRRRGQFAAAA